MHKGSDGQGLGLWQDGHCSSTPEKVGFIGRVSGLGFRVLGFGFRVYGRGFPLAWPAQRLREPAQERGIHRDRENFRCMYFPNRERFKSRLYKSQISA